MAPWTFVSSQITDILIQGLSSEKPFPLIREAIQTIGEAQPTILSVLDLKQAYHCLKLSPKCQKYCSFTSYFGGKSYNCLRLPMGLSKSPTAFQHHINAILANCNAKAHCIAIMDDLILYSKNTERYYRHIKTILKALQDNGLKISPSKAKLFQHKVVYMGHEIMVSKNQRGIRALRDRTEAIRKLPVPKTKRQLKGFIGKVSYLSMYLPRLQLLLQPLHKISRKRQTLYGCKNTRWHMMPSSNYWSNYQYCLYYNGLFRLYCDTSRVGEGAILWQVQDGMGWDSWLFNIA